MGDSPIIITSRGLTELVCTSTRTSVGVTIFGIGISLLSLSDAIPLYLWICQPLIVPSTTFDWFRDEWYAATVGMFHNGSQIWSKKLNKFRNFTPLNKNYYSPCHHLIIQIWCISNNSPYEATSIKAVAMKIIKLKVFMVQYRIQLLNYFHKKSPQFTFEMIYYANLTLTPACDDDCTSNDDDWILNSKQYREKLAHIRILVYFRKFVQSAQHYNRNSCKAVICLRGYVRLLTLTLGGLG